MAASLVGCFTATSWPLASPVTAANREKARVQTEAILNALVNRLVWFLR